MGSSGTCNLHHHHHYPFCTRTTSVLYTADLVFKEARSVGNTKMFSYSLSPAQMHCIHGQKQRVTASLLEQPFVFVERSRSPLSAVDAYALCHNPSSRDSLSSPGCDSCLSSSSTASASSRSNKRDRPQSDTVPSLNALRSTGFMKKLEDEEQVARAYQVFLDSPRLQAVFEDENFAGDEDFRTRRVLVPLQGTIACYSSRWDKAETSAATTKMGQLLLDSVCNFPSQRFGIPAQASSLHDLLRNDMKEMRIFSMDVQHSSVLVVHTDSHECISVFPESSLLASGKKKICTE
jgi:hypothetical protein